MPLWALPMRCGSSTAHTQQVSLENGSPQRRFPSEMRRKHHVLLVWLQTPPDSHHGQEAKHKAKKAVWEVTTPKEKYYSISSLGRGSFPWYTPLLKRKKICFPLCTGLTLATVCYSALGDIHTKLSLLPTALDLPAPLPTPPPTRLQRDVDMFLLSDACGQADAGCRGFCLLGSITSSIPGRHLSQSGSPQS